MESFKGFFTNYKSQIKELQMKAASCSSGSGSGSGGSGGGSSSTVYTPGKPGPFLGDPERPYVVNQDIPFEQAIFKDFEKDLTKERLDEMEMKSKAQNMELAKAFSTKSSKSLYQTEQISSLNWWVYYLIWIYAAVAVVFLGFLFAGPKSKKISIYIKIVVTILLLLYPYYITVVEDLLYDFGRFGSNILYGNVYLQSEY